MGQVDAPALAAGLGLDDEGLEEPSLAGLGEVVIDLGSVVGVEEGPGEVVVVVRELLLHLGQRECKGVLPRDDAHRREMVDPLRDVHPLQGLVDHAGVAPLELPLLALPEVLDPPPQALAAADLLQNRVLGIWLVLVVLARLMTMELPVLPL